MKIKIISSKDEIAKIGNTKELHCSCFISFLNAFQIIASSPNLKILELPESHEKMLSQNTRKFLELQGVSVVFANRQGQRTDMV